MRGQIPGHRTIYGLLDPRASSLQVRYVGCTVQSLGNRLQSHLRECIVGSSQCNRVEWLRELVLENLEPVIMTIEVVPEAKWQERERYWIRHYAGPYLLNMAAGGRGHTAMPEEVREKIRLAQTGKVQSQETKDRRKATMAANGYKHSDAIKQRISEAHRGRKTGPLPDAVKEKLRAKMGRLVWVNDGTANRRVVPEQIPDGWQLGRK